MARVAGLDRCSWWSPCCSISDGLDDDGNAKLFQFSFGRRRGTNLAALFDEAHIVVGLVAVDEMAEALAGLRIGDRLLPLALVGVDHVLHLRFQFGGEPELVLHHDVDEVLETALQAVAPYAGALEPGPWADGEHQEAVDVSDERRLVEIGREQLGVARLHAAVAAHVEVPALLGRDDADVLALRLRAFAGAARDREFELVRRAQALVAVLDLDRESDRVADAVAAPGR